MAEINGVVHTQPNEAEIAEATALMAQQEISNVQELLKTRIKPPKLEGLGKHAGSKNKNKGTPKKIKVIAKKSKQINRRKPRKTSHRSKQRK